MSVEGCLPATVAELSPEGRLDVEQQATGDQVGIDIHNLRSCKHGADRPQSGAVRRRRRQHPLRLAAKRGKFLDRSGCGRSAVDGDWVYRYRAAFVKTSWCRLALWALAAVSLAFIGTACAPADAGDVANPAPSVSSLILPTPTGTPLSLADAAARYQEIVNPHNMAMNRLFATQDAERPWQEQQQALANIMAADETEIVALAGTAWPADVRPLIDRLVQVKLAGRQAMSDAVHARSEGEFFRLMDRAFAHPECREANAVRAVLGLPEAGGDCS